MMTHYDLFEPIKDESNLATIFNRVLSSLNLIRLISAPVSFEKKAEKEKYPELYYETCLWEMYLHEVINKLNYWTKILCEYEAEFSSNWEYYASAKRIECIKEYGGEDDDYDSDRNIRTQNLTHEDLKLYAVTHYLVCDDWRDIVQETTPDQLDGLLSAIKAQAKVSFIDIFRQIFKQDLPLYKQDENGEMMKFTFADHAMREAVKEVETDDLSSIILFACRIVQQIIEKIRNANPFCDNKDLLKEIQGDVRSLLSLGMDL